jgi:hypothetical protein
MFDRVPSTSMAPVAPSAPEDVQLQIRRLVREFEELESRLGEPPEETASIERMQRRIASQRLQLERLEHEVQALVGQICTLEDEIHGREQALAMLLGHVLDRIDRATRDAWSPVPVLGFRLWAMHGGRLQGARNVWTEPSYTAICTAHDGNAPHSDGRCGRLGCGVYATKTLDPLVELHLGAISHSYVAAVVALSGKVVEHERGYRAQRARVVAAYAVWPDRVMATDTPGRIEALFTACDRVPGDWCDPRPGKANPLPQLIEYLNERAEEESAWI